MERCLAAGWVGGREEADRLPENTGDSLLRREAESPKNPLQLASSKAALLQTSAAQRSVVLAPENLRQRSHIGPNVHRSLENTRLALCLRRRANISLFSCYFLSYIYLLLHKPHQQLCQSCIVLSSGVGPVMNIDD